MIEKLKSNYLLIVALALSAALFLFYLVIQPRITYEFSSLFDGNKYLKVYHFFTGDSQQYKVIFPINTRILVPGLAALLPFANPEVSFLAVNFLFILLSVFSIYFLWEKTGIPPGYAMTGFFWLFIHWVGIIRLNIFDPVTVDVPLYFFQSLLLLAIYKKKPGWLLILGPLATLQKESFIGLLLVLVPVEIYLYFKQKGPIKFPLYTGLALLMSITARAIAGYVLPPDNPGNSSFITILFHLRETILDPFRLVRWIVGMITAFGPLLLLSVWWQIKKRSFYTGDIRLIVLCVAYTGLGLLGGGDFTRLIFLGFPFIMTWIFLSLKDVRGFLFKMAFLMGLPLMRIFTTIPDPAVQGWIKFNNFYPEFANPVIVLLWLIYGAGCVFAFHITEKKLAMLP